MSMTNALFGRTKDALLSALFGRPDEAFYVNELVRTLGKGTGAVQREIKNLSPGEKQTKRGHGEHGAHRG